jgi:hypothetical protein
MENMVMESMVVQWSPGNLVAKQLACMVVPQHLGMVKQQWRAMVSLVWQVMGMQPLSRMELMCPLNMAQVA